MARPKNPYIAGNPVGNSAAFVGRDDVLEAVLGFLQDPQHHGVVLYGQRRIGKTSILHHLAKWLPQSGGPRAIYFDLQNKVTWPVGQIMVELARSIADELGMPEPDAGEDAALWFRRAWLPRVLGSLPSEDSLAVLFDEFDVLADAKSQKQASETFFAYLRELLIETAPKLRLVFVIGRNLEDLSYLAGPLFKAMPSKHVSLLSRSEAEAVVRLSEKSGTLTWSDDAVVAAWALTHGQPYLLQHICWQVWQRAHANGPAGQPASASDVEAAVPHTLDASWNVLEWLWGGLPPAGRVVASALAKAGPGAISDDGLYRVLRESGVSVVIRDLKEAPKLLQEWDLLEVVEGGHRFRVELLRRWIAQFKPLSRVQEELDRINPLAETLFQAGDGFRRAGRLDEAVAQLRQALGMNPNHLKAGEMLAEILISRSAWDDARQVLERLEENYAGVARPRLAQVFLAKAQAESEDDKRLEWYERVLKNDERNAAALEGKRVIWKSRGSLARAEGRLEDALAAYREAGREDLEKQVTEQLRATGLARVQQRLGELEQAEQHATALELIQSVGDTYAGIKDWQPDIERLMRAAHMLANYQRAKGALNDGDKQTATQIISRIVVMDPKYKDAAKLLYEAVSGESVDDLHAQVEEEARGKKTTWLRMRLLLVTMLLAGGAMGTLMGTLVGTSARSHPAATVMPAPASVPVQALASPSASAAPVVSAVAAMTPTQTPEPSCPAGMAPIPGGGIYKMGAVGGEPDEEPHDVRVEAFCLDRTEVTVAAYCVANDGCTAAVTEVEWPDISRNDRQIYRKFCNGGRADRQDHPINCITWSEANTYCRSRAARLPTEEEWEYAARGGHEQWMYPWGNQPPAPNLLNACGSECVVHAKTIGLTWKATYTGSDGFAETAPVGSFPEGIGLSGIHDLGGNVAEWTASTYCRYGQSCASSDRVVRGGSWSHQSPRDIRSAHRDSYGPGTRAPRIGFRCAAQPALRERLAP